MRSAIMFFTAFSLAAATCAYAAPTIELVNHTGENLSVDIGIGSKYLPDLAPTFILYDGTTAASEVTTDGDECLSDKDNNPSTFIKLVPKGANSYEKTSAFLSTGLACHNQNQVAVGGIEDACLGYHWQTTGDVTVVTFFPPKSADCIVP